MTGGKATGVYRQYQVECRDVLLFRDKQLTPWSGDGIDVLFDLPDTRWTFDIALRDQAGSPLLAECRRTVGAVKQEDVGAFAYKVEMVRKTLDIPVAGVFFTKREHQIGAVKVSQFQGIEAAIMDPGSVPPGFNITFLRYNSEREKKLREIIMHVPTGSFAMTGSPIIATVTPFTLTRGLAPESRVERILRNIFPIFLCLQSKKLGDLRGPGRSST